MSVTKLEAREACYDQKRNDDDLLELLTFLSDLPDEKLVVLRSGTPNNFIVSFLRKKMAVTTSTQAGGASTVANLVDKMYKARLGRLGMPSSLAQIPHKFILTEQSSHRQGPLILNHRPAEAAGAVPLALLAPRFGCFTDDYLRGVTHDKRFFLGFAVKLCEAMSAGFEREALRTEKLCGLLTTFLGNRLIIAQAGTAKCKVDLEITSTSMPGQPLVLVEVKNELGSGDAGLQGSVYYAKWVAEQLDTTSPQRWPVLLLEVMGSTLRISGAVFSERIQVEPLTPMLNLLTLQHEQPEQVALVAAAMAALHTAVHGLAADYQAVVPTPPAPITDSRQLPAHLVHHVAELGGATEVALFLEDKLVFTVSDAAQSLEGCNNYMVKYTKRYSKRVHDAWFKGDVAPRLLRVEQLPGGWLAVFMEWLQFSEGWVALSLALEPWTQKEEQEEAQAGSCAAGSQSACSPGEKAFHALDALRASMARTPQTRQALCQHIKSRLAHAHGLAIDEAAGAAGASSGGGSSGVGGSSVRGAHGDMRPPNIMLKLMPGEEGTSLTVDKLPVRFIDYDWAGIAGEATYPLFISDEVPWPVGVQPGGQVQQDHDCQLLDKTMEARTTYTYQWHRDQPSSIVEALAAFHIGG